MMRANIWLRTASRILVRIAQFKATAFYELEKRAKRIPWNRFLASNSAADFRVTSRKSKLYHSDAIAQRLQKAAGGQQAADGSQLFVVRVLKDEFVVSADTSGELLHMRGYRQAVGKAPLRETLAAALVLVSEWTGDTALVDPFCGSGTIPIEGALIARRIAPGLQRDFAFRSWPDFDVKAWQKVKSEALAARLAGSPVPIVASDRDGGAIESARANAERAGVAESLELSVRPVSAVGAPGRTGLVATNPPYGVRVGERTSLRDLYARFGQVLRERFMGWRVAIYSPSNRLTDQIALPFHEAMRTTSGGIRISALIGDVSP